MSFTVQATIEITGDDPDFAERHAERLGDLMPFHQQCGVHMMGAMLGRLEGSLNMGEDVVRTGMLTGSLKPGGGEGTVFDIGPTHAEAGSNLPYAAQVNEGGTIEPATGKALAIPLTRQLKLSGDWPRDFPKDSLVFVPSKTGRGIGLLFEKSGSGDLSKRPLFALVARVHQEGKHFAVIDEGDLTVFEELLYDHLAA